MKFIHITTQRLIECIRFMSAVEIFYFFQKVTLYMLQWKTKLYTDYLFKAYSLLRSHSPQLTVVACSHSLQLTAVACSHSLQLTAVACAVARCSCFYMCRHSPQLTAPCTCNSRLSVQLRTAADCSPYPQLAVVCAATYRSWLLAVPATRGRLYSDHSCTQRNISLAAKPTAR